jgi:hypothetical protein
MNEFLYDWNVACAYARECIMPPAFYEHYNLLGFMSLLSVACLAAYIIGEIKR